MQRGTSPTEKRKAGDVASRLSYLSFKGPHHCELCVPMPAIPSIPSIAPISKFFEYLAMVLAETGFPVESNICSGEIRRMALQASAVHYLSRLTLRHKFTNALKLGQAQVRWPCIDSSTRALQKTGLLVVAIDFMQQATCQHDSSRGDSRIDPTPYLLQQQDHVKSW